MSEAEEAKEEDVQMEEEEEAAASAPAPVTDSEMKDDAPAAEEKTAEQPTVSETVAEQSSEKIPDTVSEPSNTEEKTD